jgi:Mor family transcriptional regulator
MGDIIKKLRKLDEVLLMELLEVTSTELVDAFLDKIEERRSYLEVQLEDMEND